MEAWASCLFGSSAYVDHSPCHMDPWLHSPGLESEDAQLHCEQVLDLSEPAHLGYFPQAWSDGDWG